MRKLLPEEEQRVALLTSKSVEFSLIEPTATGLKKSIMDATAPVRKYLLENKLHDYADQSQGPEHKIFLDAQILTLKTSIPAQASLYRPKTKKGDPRIWFKKFAAHAKPNDIWAIVAYEGTLNILNLSGPDISQAALEQKSGPIWDLLQDISGKANEVSVELLGKLKAIASQGFVRSVLVDKADTAVGRTLETLLGVEINSRKEPDYKGIELKSFRSHKKGRENRKTLFAQVASWDASKFKSSREILDAFGYERDEDFKLYCTISTQVKNSQGLRFRLDADDDQLVEFSDCREIGDFATWEMQTLRDRLLSKHRETFWVAAESQIIDGIEHFRFTEVFHTRKPIVSQFELLLEQGAITMDHLIKRNAKGKVSEKGPLFKIEAKSLELLFPPSATYDLTKNS